MYDSVAAGDIPSTAVMVAGYVNGLYAWKAEDWHRFVGSIAVSIAVTVNADADVLDVETGDAIPAQAPAWIKRQHVRGLKRPTIYCQRSWQFVVSAACSAAGLLNDMDYRLWIADWTGAPHAVLGAAVVQFANPDRSGGHFDLSAVYADDWPDKIGGPVSFQPTPAAPPTQRGIMPAKVTAVFATRTPPDGKQLDVFMVGEDGHVYHLWYMVDVGWAGPEDLSLAG